MTQDRIAVSPKTVALYARTSSDEQAQRGTIATQIEYARGRAKLEGWTLLEFVDDGVSGKKIPLAKRPAGAELLAAARRGEMSRVVTYRLDRLGRRARFIHEAIEDLSAAGVDYASLTEPFDTGTTAGKLFMGLLALMAEFESNSITDRTSDGRARVAKIDHRWLGGLPPFGYSVGEDKILVINQSEAAAVRRIFTLCVDEDLGAQRIADRLNESGIPYVSTGPRRAKRHSKQAAPWHSVAVNDILRSSLYVGRASYYKRATTKGKEVVFRTSPAIVGQTIFAAAQKAIDRRATWGSSHSKHEYLLRGLVVCGRDGRNLIGRKWYGRGDGRGRNNRAIYYCEHCPAGDRPILDERQLLEVLWTDTLGFLEHPDAALRAIARSAADSGEAEDSAEKSMLAIAEEIRELEAQEERLVDLVVTTKGQMTAAVLERKATALREARERAEQRLESARAARASALRIAGDTVAMRGVLAGLRKRVAAAAQPRGGAGRAEIVRTITKGIVVHRASGRSKVAITYAFGAVDQLASSAPAASSASLATQTASRAGLRPTPSCLSLPRSGAVATR